MIKIDDILHNATEIQKAKINLFLLENISWCYNPIEKFSFLEAMEIRVYESKKDSSDDLNVYTILLIFGNTKIKRLLVE